MAARSEELKADLLERILKRVRDRMDPERRAAVEAFVRQFYARVPPVDLADVSADDLYGAALAIWGFAQKRPASGPKIRAHSPRLEEQGWRSSHTIVEIVNDDMPFLVDSVSAELNRLDVEVHLIIHPIMAAERDAKGRLLAYHEVGKAPEATRRESLMHIQISEQPPERHEEIEKGLGRVLADVRAAVDDWQEMRALCQGIIAELEKSPPPLPKEEIEEGLAFLKWLDDDHFTYLGYREYVFEGRGGDKPIAAVTPDSGRGLLRDEEVYVFDGLRTKGAVPQDVLHFLKEPSLFRITKANRMSTVHRRVHLDSIAVKCFDAKGKVTGERLFVGLLTSVAYSRSPMAIPVLRQKVSNAIGLAGFDPRSHDGKALLHILETFPRDELFQIGERELHDIAMGILHLQERQRIALFLRRDPFERFVSCLVYVPRDRFDTSLRLRFQQLIASAFEGEIAAFYTHVTDAVLARLHLIVKTTPGRIPEVDLAALEQSLSEAARSWEDHLEEALIEDRGEEQGIRGVRRFGTAFSAGYQEHFSAQTAVFDIRQVEATLTGGQMAMNLYRPIEAEEHQVHFKTFMAGPPVALSDILPMLENMGLRVIGEVPFDVRPRDRVHPVWIHDFEIETEDGAPIDLSKVKEAFHDVFGRVWRGEMENDGFNKLVLRAGLTAREVQVLRAYCKYLRQAQIPFSQAYMEQTLKNNPQVARRLVDLFLARFDPTRFQDGRDRRIQEIVAETEALLEAVGNLDEDRIIRRFLNVIQSTLRTNFFQPDAEGGHKPYISFKLDSRNLDELPLPRPFREIFVYSPRVEGVHLRFGMVARGGLRWSDRREDFRTEILGLVKAQQVKNAVIVPVGSKGGFVVKRPPAPEAGREAFLEEGIACYKTFIRGLLDITDNLKAGKLVPPDAVVRHDRDDPYLVVAADKGTATFSDIANGVSADYGHWLDDAFASGGSAGYDHKKMGITARGAWESVKRHFRELGKDIQNEDFTCVGVGDMSGDVFGNGMLLSRHIKLLGAFNHLHIFVDPDPDPAESWVERKRLFDTPGTAWTDYDAKLISKGGGVFDRKAKSIKLSPEIKARFGIKADQLPPNELIRALLTAEVELLWFGGIGTYVKARQETHADAGDRANDALRIDAAEVRAKVIGEGANLGLTQKGRIAYGLAGGRCNTDSIDNSAGVDCSDHEVNIKILLGEIEEAGDLTRKQRDRLLEKMTDEVADLVLRDNYLQSQAITVTHLLGAHLLDRLARFMRSLERVGQLDRAIEALPDDETVEERMKAGIGLTRPEISVLLSYAKIVLYDEILASDLPDDPYLQRDLADYFPQPLRKKYATQIKAHRLHREIKATVATNAMINRVGVTFIYEVKEKTGMPAADIARAYMISREIFGMEETWDAIEALDNKVPAQLQANMLMECGRLIERGTVWFLREAGYPLDISTQIARYGVGVRSLSDNLAEVISEADERMLGERAAAYQRQGAPEDLSRRIASLGLLVPACDIVRIALAAELPVARAARTYFTIGARFGFDWLRRASGQLPTDTAWDKLAVTAIVDDLYGHQGELTGRVLEAAAGNGKTDGLIEAWAEARRPLVARTDQLVTELQATGTPDFAMLAVANRQLKSLVGS